MADPIVGALRRSSVRHLVAASVAACVSVMIATSAPGAFAAESARNPASFGALEPSGMLGEWFIVAQSAGWLERQIGRPSVRFARTGPNTYTTTISHLWPGTDVPCTDTQEAWFEDSGTNRQWRERVLGPFVRRAEVRALSDDYLILSSVTGKDFWLLSRTAEPSSGATAALAREVEAAGVANSELHWPYRKG